MFLLHNFSLLRFMYFTIYNTNLSTMPRAKKGIGRRYKTRRPRDDISNLSSELSSVSNAVNTVDSSLGGCSTSLNENLANVDDCSFRGRCLTSHNVNDNSNTDNFFSSNIPVPTINTNPHMSPNTNEMLHGSSLQSFSTSNDGDESSDINDTDSISNEASSNFNISTNHSDNANDNVLLATQRQSDDLHCSELPKNDTLFSSYGVRRRHVRHIKKYIKSLNTKEQKIAIVSDLFNDHEILPLLRAGGMVPPKEAIANKKLLDQFSKQLNRSSIKDSFRGRINDDLQSYRINAVGMLMDSPINNDDELKFNKEVFRVISNNSSIPRTSARRLMQKATNQRKKLSNMEKCNTWSIITHRKSYNTKQNLLNASLFEWILNHPHVVASPIFKDTVIVRVQNSDGSLRKERVGKLLLEISVRALIKI